MLPTTEKRDGYRDTTSTSETDDRDTEERVEGSGRSKVDTGQGHLDGGVEEEGVQWHFETLGDSTPKSVSGNTTISGEAVCQLGTRTPASRELTPKHIEKPLESKLDRTKDQ